MLNISNLSVQFGGNFLFDSVSFALRRNDRIGLIGRNGTGKSTLLKIINGQMQPEEGSVHKPNGYKIGYLPQEIDSHSTKSIYDEAYSALIEINQLENTISNLTDELSSREDYESEEYNDIVEQLSNANDRLKILGGHSIEAEIETILTGLGFERSDFSRSMQEFSGGWQMRVELAKILLAMPDCVLLDEPTNHLDIDSIRWLEGFLKSYPGAIILVSHDKAFLDNVTNRTLELIHGDVIDMPLSYSKFIEARKIQKEQQLNAYKNQQKQIAETEKYIERFRYKATLASRVQSRIKLLDKVDRIELEEEDNSSLNLRFPEPPRSSRLIIETKKLTKKYGSKLVLNSIDFAIERGEKVAFVGKNGEGKTTLSKIIGGFEPFDGELIQGNNVIIGYYAQHQASELTGDLSVFDLIDSAATGDMRTKVRSLLGAFLFSGDSVYKKVKVLSGGEKSRLALAKILLEPVNLLILDEPTNHLDMAAKEVLKNALIDFSGALIVVSHDRDFLEGLTQKTYEFKNNKISEYLGDINYYLEKKNLESLKELEKKNVIKQASSSEIPSKNQSDRERKKEFQREENKLNKAIANCESEIANLENRISEIDKLFADSEFFSNQEKYLKTKQEYDKLRNDLDEKMNQWDKLVQTLDNLKTEYSDII